MKKKVFALILAALMLLTVFAGCTGDNPSNPSGNVKPSNGTNESGSPVDPSEEDGPKNYEYAELTIGIPSRATIDTMESPTNKFTAYFEENLNLKLNFMFFPADATNYLRQLALMASTSTEKMPDVLVGFGLGANLRDDYGDAGFFVDLNQHMDQLPNMKKQFARTDADIMARLHAHMYSLSGAIYGAPLYFENSAVDDMVNMMWVNQEWLDKLGLKKPTTVKELHDVLVAFRDNDCNGNNDKGDEYPCFGAMGPNGLLNYVINAYIYFDAGNPFDVINGKPELVPIREEYRNAMILLNQWYKEKLIPQISITATGAERKATISPNSGVAKVGIWNGHPATQANQTSAVLDSYVYLDPLKAETDLGGYLPVSGKVMQFNTFITEDCENLDAALRFVDFFFVDETISRMRHGVKDEDWYYELGTNIFGDDDAYINCIDSSVFFEGNHTWGGNFAGYFTSQNYFAVENFKYHYDENIGRMLHEQIDVMNRSRTPEKLVREQIYTNEEYERLTDIRTPSSTWISTWFTYFLTGEKNPASDKDWQEYLDGLKTYGLDEWVKLVQDIYDDQPNRISH